MATPTFDLSGLPLLEGAITAMLAAQAATPSTFTGAQAFNCSYLAGIAGAQPGSPGAIGVQPATMTTRDLQSRLVALKLAFDKLNL